MGSPIIALMMPIGVFLLGAFWFRFSLSPGSWLGFAFSKSGWDQLFGDLRNEELQTPASRRSAGHRALFAYSVLLPLLMYAGISAGRTNLASYATTLLPFYLGLVVGYLLLLRSTHPSRSRSRSGRQPVGTGTTAFGMANPAYFAEPRLLPDGFVYPEAYLAFARSSPPTCIGPANQGWCVLDDAEIERYFGYVRKAVPGRVLVPFMRRIGEDGVACFDWSVPSGDPPICLCRVFNGVGCWPQSVTFSEWLARVSARGPKGNRPP